MRLRSYFVIAISLTSLAWLSLASAQEVVPSEAHDSVNPPKISPTTGGKTEAQSEHTVVPGDNLWDLCARYLNNPWYWPRVWSYNPELSNPHWVYPGQIVRFFPSGQLPSQLDTIETSGQFEVPDTVEDDIDSELVPGELVSMSGDFVRAKTLGFLKLNRNAYVTKDDEKGLGKIYASREEKEYLSEFDSIYIHFKNAPDVKVGQQYSIMRTIQKIHHPITEKLVGYQIMVLGICQVVKMDESAVTAIITTSVQPIKRGDRIGPLMPQLAKRISPKANSVELRGYVVGSKVGHMTLLGETHMVFIDQGKQQGVEEGNTFDVVRREDSLFIPGSGKEANRWDTKVPPEIYGRIMVVDARDNASTGIVIAAMRELRVGDRVYMGVQ